MGSSQLRMRKFPTVARTRQAVEARSLMERVHAGDPCALDEILQRYWWPLVSYATRLLSDRDAAEDVVQEAMLRLWERRREWTPTQRLQGFLYRITRNLALNEHEKKEVRRAWAESPRGEPPRPVPTPLELTERAELRRLLDRLVDKLPPKRREVFILARYHAHAYREIAEIMDISPQTVANQMSAALDELREALRPQIDAFLARGPLRVIRGAATPTPPGIEEERKGEGGEH